MNEQLFHCNKCGACCNNLRFSALYSDLDDGTGKCKYFNKADKLCSIYEDRPEKCNVVAMYKYFKKTMDFKEYMDLNKKSCEMLRGL